MKIERILTALLCVSMLCGCGDGLEPNRIGMVGADAYERKDGQTYVTMHILQNNDAHIRVVTGVGNGCAEAFENADTVLEKRVYPAHVSVHFMGESYLQNGLREFNDMVLRDGAFRIDVPVMAVRGTEAGTFLQQTETRSEDLYRIVHEAYLTGKTAETTVAELIDETDTAGIHPIVGCVRADRTESGVLQTVCGGSAIIKNDCLVGYLEEQQTRLCQLIRGKPMRYTMVTEKNGAEVIVESKRSILRVSEESAQVDVALYVSVSENQNAAETEHIVRETRAQMKNAIEETVREIQTQYGMDIFGFGKQIRTQDGEAWDEKFAQMTVAANVKVILKNKGQLRE